MTGVLAKLSGAFAVVGAGDLIWQATHGTLEFIVLLGAVIAAVPALWRRARKTAHAIDVMVGLPAWQKKVDNRFDEGDKRMDEHGAALTKLSAAVEEIAAADKLRIKDAIAGDERSPAIDRRSSST